MERATLCQLYRTKVDVETSTSTKPPPALALEVEDRVVCRDPVHMGDATATKARRVVEHMPHDVMHVELVSIDRDNKISACVGSTCWFTGVLAEKRAGFRVVLKEDV
ncbi:MAG: hypothetical protein CMM87_06790 [Rickettsiales bacterium]|nr:hypothetical protein [Rickettsiales bacterium]